ncbi:hypothetical protein DENSPDRAFT_880854 [Dentipellis sp. KUC8613]|nr:hypothetical protein DENSPDRAFT_880854 [Dentipellis sp. KUC8613]
MDAGDYIPPESPRWAPAALTTSSRRPRHRPHPSFSEPAVSSPENMSEAAAMTQHPYQIDEEDPLQVICEHFHVAPPAPLRTAHLRKTHDLPCTGTGTGTADTHLPTHLLAVFDLPFGAPDTPVTLIPVRADTLAAHLSADIPLPPALPPSTIAHAHPHSHSHAHAHTSASPHSHSHAHTRTLRLPVIPIQVPHAPSIPLLLQHTLFPDPSTLAAQLLPLAAVEEFPSAAAMAHVMAACCDGDRLARYLTYNQGVWKNVLALGVRDREVAGVVQTVWNVTAEARRVWQQQLVRGRERERSRSRRRERERERER